MLNPKLVDEMEHFFISYDQIHGKVFKPLARFGPKRSLELIQKGRDAFGGKNTVKT